MVISQAEGFSGTTAFTQSPLDGLGSVALFPVPIVTVRNLAGATDTSFAGPVRASLMAEGEEVGVFSATAVLGVATFNGLIVGNTGTYSLRATVSGKRSATTADFNLS